MKCRSKSAQVAGYLVALMASRAMASGFQLQEQSASGLGVAYSGMAAATLDASTAFWNPAGMAFIPKTQVVASINYIVPDYRFTSSGPPPTGSTYDAFGNGGDGGVSAAVPALYMKMNVTPDVAFGLSFNSPFGLSTEWNAQWAGMFHAIKSQVETLNINPALSYRVGDLLSLGIGASYQRLRATLTEGVTPLVPTAQARLDGTDWAWGWNAGALLDFGQGTRVGVTYRSNLDYRIAGTLSFNSPAFAALDSSASTVLRLPSVASLAVSQEVGKVRVLADFSFTKWNSIQQLVILATSGPAAGQVVSAEQLAFRNSWRAGAGLEYRTSEPWLWRAGVAYDRSPVQDAFRTPRLPDNDRSWLAAGARYSPNSSFTLDVGYAYLWVKSAPSELAPVGPVPGALLGSYHLKTSIVGVQGTVAL